MASHFAGHLGTVAVVVAALLLAATGSAALAEKPVVVGDPSDPAALQGALQRAYEHGAHSIAIRKGVYTMPSSDHDVLLLDGWRGAAVSAEGVTIVAGAQKWPTAIFHLNHCKGVVVSGGLLTQTEITAYQGRVTSVDPGDGADGSFSCTWSPDAGYPVLPADVAKIPSIDFVDQTTRMLKVGTADYYGVKGVSLANNAFRFTGFGRHAPNIAVGDWIVMRRDIATAIKVHLDDCENCTVKNVSMMRMGFAPIFETGGAGGNHILGCRWLVGPKPDGASETPLVSTMADGFHSTGTAVGPDIEDCTMEGILLDDCIAIHGSFSEVLSSSGNTLTFKGRGSSQFAVGEPATICDKNGFYSTAQVTAVQVEEGGVAHVTLDREMTIPAQSKAFNPRRCGAGYKIVNNHIGRTRSRAILVKGDNGLIEGNTIVAAEMSAVSIGPEFYWDEAGYVQHVVVRNNIITHCGGSGYGSAILVHGDGALGNSEIVIERNKLTENYQGEFDIAWAKNVAIRDNTITGWPRPAPVLKAPTLAQFVDSSDIEFRGNRLTNAAGYAAPLVVSKANVTGLSVTGNKGIDSDH